MIVASNAGRWNERVRCELLYFRAKVQATFLPDLQLRKDNGYFTLTKNLIRLSLLEQKTDRLDMTKTCGQRRWLWHLMRCSVSDEMNVFGASSINFQGQGSNDLSSGFAAQERQWLLHVDQELDTTKNSWNQELIAWTWLGLVASADDCDIWCVVVWVMKWTCSVWALFHSLLPDLQLRKDDGYCTCDWMKVSTQALY